MIPPKELYELLSNRRINFFTGVPDSTLRDFCNYVTENSPPENHIIAANEGGAISLAVGYHLATGKIPLVYMQNSGQGNSMNPLVSLADSEVYSIPLLLIIGWRGEPGTRDEPQHLKQGKITLKFFETLEIPFEVLPDEIEKIPPLLNKAIGYLKKNSSPYAIIVKKNTFDKFESAAPQVSKFPMTREDALKIILNELGEKDAIISTTGKLSRELFEYRKLHNQEHNRDFLVVGSMGHASQIALGIALQKPDKNIYCLDGDGAVIMHMGSLPVIGQQAPKNFKHIVFNNGAHDSVGGQPTAASNLRLSKIAEVSGYRKTFAAKNEEELNDKLDILEDCEGPALLEIDICKGSRKDLSRPTISLQKNKKSFMDFLQQ